MSTTSSRAETAADESRGLTNAYEALEAGRLRESEEWFTHLLASPGCEADAYYGLGVVSMDQGDVNRAEEMLWHAVEHDDRMDNAWYYLGEISEVRSPSLAFEYYERALRLNPNHRGASTKIRSMRERPAPQTAPQMRPADHLSGVPTVARFAPGPSSVEGGETKAGSEIAALGVYEFLLQDGSPMSEQATQLIDSLNGTRRLCFSAYLGGVIRRAMLAILIGAAVTVVAREAATKSASAPTHVTAEAILIGGCIAGLIWLLTVGALFIKVRTWRVTLTNGRIYSSWGVFRKRHKALDLWLVHEVSLERPLLNRLTGDGEIILSDGKRSYKFKGFAKRNELQTVYQKLQDLKFVLRANPVVKGIIQ